MKMMVVSSHIVLYHTSTMRNITLEGKKKSTAFYKKKRKKNKNIKK